MVPWLVSPTRHNENSLCLEWPRLLGENGVSFSPILVGNSEARNKCDLEMLL